MKYRNLQITLAFLILLAGVSLAFWLLPDKSFSPEENRVLQAFPSLSIPAWTSGELSDALTSYFSDQFPARSLWLGLHAASELATGRGESNGVLLGTNGQLAVRRHDMYVGLAERAEDTDVYRAAHVEAGLDALLRLDRTLGDEGIPLTVLLAPRTVDVVADVLSYPSALSDRLDACIRERLAGIDSPNLLADFRARYAAGEYIYFRTDHHWTVRGAYAAYTAVLASFGMQEDTRPLEDFSLREIPDFYGTTHARAGIPFIPADTLEIPEALDGSDAHFTVRDERGEVVIESGFINEKYLSGKDKYGAFLDGTHRLLTITDSTATSPRPRLLLARDSFGASMVPFLARHFDVISVNLSGGMTDLSSLAREYACDRVLVVCNRENLLTSDCLVRIR